MSSNFCQKSNKNQEVDRDILNVANRIVETIVSIIIDPIILQEHELWYYLVGIVFFFFLIKFQSPDESFFVLNVEDVLQKFNNWNQKLPGITPYYGEFANLLLSLG